MGRLVGEGWLFGVVELGKMGCLFYYNGCINGKKSRFHPHIGVLGFEFDL
jgi:hypothetical protein